MTMKPRLPARRLRQLQDKARELTGAKLEAEEDILVFIHEATAEGASQAAVAGMFSFSPSNIAPKAAKGAEIKAERSGRSPNI